MGRGDVGEQHVRVQRRGAQVGRKEHTEWGLGW